MVRVPILKNTEYGTNIYWDTTLRPFMMVVGNSGVGKTTLLLQLIALVAKYSCSNTKLILLDYKNSDDFAFCHNNPNYYGYETVKDGFNRFYDEFKQRLLKKSIDSSEWWLVFDEYASWISMLPKKESEDYKLKLGEILRLGRSLNMRMIFVLQRADTQYFISGIRDNFVLRIGLGRLSRESQKMLFDTDMVLKPQKIGKGYIQQDGYEVECCFIPKVRNFKLIENLIIDFLSRLE